MMLNIVLLPQPLGPMMEMNSPGRAARSTPSSTASDDRPLAALNALVTPRSSILAVAPSGRSEVAVTRSTLSVVIGQAGMRNTGFTVAPDSASWAATLMSARS